MLDYNPNVDFLDEQQFDANGMPIPMGGYTNVQTEATPKMMTPAMTDEQVHEAAEVAEAWKKELQRALKASKFMGGGGMLNSKKDTGGRNKAVKRVPSLKTSEKPGWMMAEGTNFWTVNTDDPYWDTKEGYDEAIALYGESPAWSTMPVQPKQMLNNNRNTVAANLKKYF